MKMARAKRSASRATLERYYRSGQASWDIGRPQAAIDELIRRRDFQDPVLDLGCGTGEHARLLASRGHTVTALDISPSAIEAARRKLGDTVQLVTADFLTWSGGSAPRTKFGAVLDVGMFHCLGDADVERYLARLEMVVRPGGQLFLLCLAQSPHERATWPHHRSEAELRALFEKDWTVLRVTPTLDESTFSERGFAAHLLEAERKVDGH